MKKISIVMPTYNAEKYVNEAIESVLNQSFSDFEYIIIDDGSTDNTVSIIRSFEDTRIKLFENKHNFIESLNLGIRNASSKYIARMDADDIMHIDRLKIQYAIMEEESEFIVCTSWVRFFGENISGNTIMKSQFGILKYPLLYLLKNNFLFHPSAIIRTSFLHKHFLEYENYDYAEDYKLWTEIAKRGGVFYVESQPLLYYRMNTNQVFHQYRKEQIVTALKIRREILDYLLELNNENYSSLSLILKGMIQAKEENILNENDILDYFYDMLIDNNENFILR